MAQAVYFLEHLKLAKIAVSIGEAETLIQLPSHMTHRSYNFSLDGLNFSEKTIRLSVGLEDPEDIIEDLQQALEKTYQKMGASCVATEQ